MRILNKYLKVVDLELWSRLEEEKILPQYYSFRWLALLLAQEFGLYETMKLWDVMLSFDGYRRYFFLYCCCISILKYRREVILHHDFISILPAIQKLRDANVNKIIETATKLYEKYSKVNI
jgi:TBC1 domain family member 13